MVDRYRGPQLVEQEEDSEMPEAEPSSLPVIGEERVANLVAALLAGDTPALQEEIRVLRLVLAKSLLEVHDPVRLATDVPRITSVLVRATQVNQILAAGAGEMAQAVATALRELGLDEEE